MSKLTTALEGEREKIPNPGSDEAIKKGCLCPILDNNHGKSSPFPDSGQLGGMDGWWIHEKCKLHNNIYKQV